MPTSTFRYLFKGLLASLVLVLALARPVQATHIVGGELDLQYLSGNDYQLTLNLYFDAVNGQPGALDPEMVASLFEIGSNRRMLNVALRQTSNTLVAYTSPACTNPDLVTRRIVYSRLITLPPQTYANAAGYYIAVERCCRNNGINNILNPSGAAQTFYLEIPPVTRNGAALRNSTPRIFPPLSDYACRGELFYYNFGGQDIDGDSLVYDLVTPLNGHTTAAFPNPGFADPAPYAPISWLPGLSATNQIPGAPGLSIGRLSGRLEVRPTQVGLFVFAIRCTEYRKGVRLGEVRRDFQLKVIPCSTNARPKVLMQLPGTTRAYLPGRDTLRLTPGNNRCVTLRFTDADPTSALTLSLRPVNFTGPLPTLSVLQGTVRAPGQPDTLVSRLCFPECLSSKQGVYLLDVMVADNGCSLPKRDTVRIAFISVPNPNGPPQLKTTAALPLRARVGDLITFDLNATDPDGDPLTLTMTGRGFAPAGLGATLSQGSAGTGLNGRFSWRVDCRAVDKPLYEFEFTAAASPCNELQPTTVVIPIQIDYRNTPPALTTSFSPPVAADSITVVRRPIGGVFEATLSGTDLEQDGLVLSAAGNGFDLAAAGMTFTPRNGAGTAAATFRWVSDCEAVRRNGLEVTFQLQETTCRPQPRTRTVRFEVEPPQAQPFLPPNIITPYTVDGKNDEFTLDNAQANLPPDFCDSRFADILIFSRWGNQVYRSANRSFRWDGGRLPAGVYFYLIEFTDGKKYKGTVTIAN
ncbi:gliding motility-associated C-terminal domain-containing protein [Hymenobacter endophyticus]|uniref:Gliding motility-associated C-terminal domain-containing protein n=1 Tax=Hymenobacter endophyticus TaxID=3076335 RepID=A0ABU3TFT1_9BACT|nr:gliding motility-associated C-terminal domain-containing protein [Hymenobacter endophyticus]MDU0370224.1 gliding motility-associated C-terminal domain-containing protein [Hymenobacter endophyticus]